MAMVHRPFLISLLLTPPKPVVATHIDTKNHPHLRRRLILGRKKHSSFLLLLTFDVDEIDESIYELARFWFGVCVFETSTAPVSDSLIYDTNFGRAGRIIGILW